MKNLKSILPFLLLIGFLAVVVALILKDETPKDIQIAFTPQQNISLDSDFGDYWYKGEAELASYDLEQSRYGEIHSGDAVLVFVTEPFSASKQVKLDNPDNAGNDKVDVLKLNFTKKFNTGIYPYSIMTSSFTPIQINQHPNSFKITTSVQEWCGHTFTQLNLEAQSYKVQSISYFESEGDKTFKLQKALLEDELWSRIRISPESLPIGELSIIPSTMVSHLIHHPLKVEKAKVSLEKINKKEQTYALFYPELDRRLVIRFETDFPHKILGWEETYPSIGGKKLTTKATLKAILKTDYWNKNSKADSTYREKLGLSQ